MITGMNYVENSKSEECTMIASKDFGGDDEEAMYEKKEGIYIIRAANSGCDHRCTCSCQLTDIC